MAAPTQFAYRTLKGIGLVDAAPLYEPLPGFQRVLGYVLPSIYVLLPGHTISQDLMRYMVGQADEHITVRPEGNLRCCTYSPCGRYFAWASTDQVHVIDASVGHIITTLPTPNVYELGFSPRGSYIITWERPSKDDEGNASKNLKVWRVIDDDTNDEERSPLGKFVQKSQTGWNLQYTYDEKYCARVVTNEVQLYQSGDLGTVWNKLREEGAADFAISPGKNHSIAVFVPERKGQPAAVKVYNVPHFASAVSQKTFFKGDKVQLKWNDLGTSVIVLAQTEVDKTGKSYYGETNLYILSANGGFDSRIQLDKEGPIHDVTWSPNSKEFGVVYGYMPAKTTIFNVRAEATYSFALGPRNTISFSPHGRFVLVAGFGNLAGQMDIYDLEKNYRKVTTIEGSNASVCEWSPDGKHILTATISPRLRVDNGVRIWHVSGGLMYNEDLAECYHVCWRPQSTETHPVEDPSQLIPTPHASALAYLETVKTPSKPAGAYRPPGARGTITPLHFKREDEGGAAHVSNGISSFSGGVNGFGKPRKREVPGAEVAGELPGGAPGGGVSLAGTMEGEDNVSKAALKNKKKREAKKAKEAADKAAGLSTALADGEYGVPENRSPERRDRRSHERSRSKSNQDPRSWSQQRQERQDGNRHKRNRSQGRNTPGASKTTLGSTPNLAIQPASNAAHPAAAGAAAPPVEAPDLTITSPGGGSPQEKKVRALLKKIRAIDDLKMRLAGGEKLEDTQIKKMATEDGVRRELQVLGWNE
ncbi:MAG: hypothetical protein M1827_000099 [Pycnora praestabilis]|nr:MAG: hypothetical protein M1827_000099 [Pycnora praestabilis]